MEVNGLISKQDAVNAICAHLPYVSEKRAEIILREVPSAQPEIIRCKDCKYRHTGDCPMYHVEWVEYDDDGYIEMDDIEYDNTADDGFCYKGGKG